MQFNFKYLAMLTLLVTSFSCKDALEKLLTFSFNQQASFEIPASSIVDIPLTIPTPDISSSSNSEFSKNGTSKELVKNIRLTALNLMIDSPADADFGFLKSVEIFLDADGLDPIKIAFQDDVPDEIGDFLALNTVDQNIDAYIKQDKFNLEIKAVTDEVITQNIAITAFMTFQVTADPF